MAEDQSAWDFTELPDGRTLRDPVASGASRMADFGQLQGVWIAAPVRKHLATFLAVFVSALLAFGLVFFPLIAAAPLILLLFGFLAVLVAYLASPKGLGALSGRAGAAWLYLPQPPPPKDAAEQRIRQVLQTAKFYKVRQDADDEVPVWYGDDVVMLTLTCYRSAHVEGGPPPSMVPRTLYLETKGGKHRDLHRRLKGQLLYALDDRYAQNAQPFEEMKHARLVEERPDS